MNKRKVALVTGGTRGIGLAIAKQLAQDGADVAITATSPSAEEAVQSIRALGVKCDYYACDVSDGGRAEATVKQVIADFGGLDILVNNAGVTADKLLVSMSQEDFERVISVNLVGAFNMIRACIRHFMRSRCGRIVNISSVVGLMGNAGQVNYAASKAGIIGLTKTVAREYASRGITCNAVAPGFIRTAMTDTLRQEYRDEVCKNIPVGRFGEAEEVARVVSFLADERSGYITGEVIKVDGGIYI